MTDENIEPKSREFQSIYSLDTPVEEGSNLLIPMFVAEEFERKFKVNGYLLGEAGYPRKTFMADTEVYMDRITKIDPSLVAIKITEVEVNADNKTLRIKAIPYGPRKSVCELSNPGVKLGYRGFMSNKNPWHLRELITFDLISDR